MKKCQSHVSEIVAFERLVYELLLQGDRLFIAGFNARRHGRCWRTALLNNLPAIVHGPRGGGRVCVPATMPFVHSYVVFGMVKGTERNNASPHSVADGGGRLPATSRMPDPEVGKPDCRDHKHRVLNGYIKNIASYFRERSAVLRRAV